MELITSFVIFTFMDRFRVGSVLTKWIS